MDAIGGPSKTKSFEMSIGQNAIYQRKIFYADELVRDVKSLYISKDGTLIEPSGVKTAPRIPSTLEVRKAERVTNEDGICKLKVYKISHRSRALSLTMAQA